MDWDCIYTEALITRDKIVVEDSFTVDTVRTALERLMDIDIAFLNAVGLFNYPRLVNQEELAYIIPKIEGRIECFAQFCAGLVSAFSTTITTGGNMACASFLNIVKREEFDVIRKNMVQDVFRAIVANPKSIPSVRHKIDSSLVQSMLIYAGGNIVLPGPLTYGDEMLFAIKQSIDELPGDPEILDLAKQLEELREIRKKEPKTLFTIRFSEGSVELIRKGIFFSSVSKDYPNRCLVGKLFNDAGISENELILLSMFCFSQTQEKEENRNFWPQFQRWFGFTEETCKLNSLRHACIKAFEGIQTIRTESSTQYVQTSLMHSIVSNRPMSKQNAYRLFEKLFKHNGYVGHTKEDIELLVTELMESGSISIPSETRNAYKYNPDQAVDFLIDQYGYYETKMLDFLGYEQVIEDTPSHFALTDYIDQMISSISQDPLQTQRLKTTAREDRSKIGKFHSPYLTIDRNGFDNWAVSICYGYYNLKDEDLAMAEKAIIMVEGKQVASLEIIEGEIVGEKIPVDYEWIGKKVSLVVGNDTIDTPVTIPENLLFDFTTHRIVSRRLMRNCRHYLLVSNPGGFSFDDAIFVGKSTIPDMNVYDITLDENNFILLNGGIVGISSDDTIGHDFLDTGGIAVDADITMVDGSHIPIRSDWPKINLISEKEAEVIVNVNGHSVEYVEDVRELRDGSGRMYRKINVYEPFPNLKVIDFSVIVEGIKKLSDRFYALMNFEYSLDKTVYKPEDKVTVNMMSFENMREAFGQKHYMFPGRYETLKFKLIDGNAITITPPMFEFALANGRPISVDMPASDFKDGIISKCAPGLEKDLRVFVEDDKGVCGWARKGKGGIWDCSNLLSSNKGATGKYSLIACGLEIKHTICNLYFCPTVTEQSIRYHSNRNIRTGREDGIYYHCHILGATTLTELTIKICNDTGKSVMEITPREEDMYIRLPDDFRAGKYSVSISEQHNTVFRKTTTEKVYPQPDVVFEGRPVNGDLIMKVTSVVVPGEKPRDVKDMGILFRGHIRKNPIKDAVLELDGSFHLSNQYTDRDIDLRVNPCKATICHITDTVIGIVVVGKDGKPLRIGENNFLNPERPIGQTKEIKSLYGVFEIKEH